MRISHWTAGVSALALLTACNAAEDTALESDAMPAETAATETMADAETASMEETG